VKELIYKPNQMIIDFIKYLQARKNKLSNIAPPTQLLEASSVISEGRFETFCETNHTRSEIYGVQELPAGLNYFNGKC
jgi:hypothetical protein